jgi:8-hydroxy-5-deazaflavin:NADPH oxidoreductase
VKIGSIGKGNVGGTLTELWGQAGHDVRAAGRGDSVADVVAHGDVVLLAVDADAVDDVLQAAGSLDGKVLIDATNDIDGKFGSLAGHVAELTPGAKVVKAFNATFASVFGAAAQLDPPANLVLCGDDEAAKQTVSGLITDIGMTPVDVGGLDQAANVEAFARMNISLAYGQGRGPQVYRFDAPNS